MLCLCYNNNMRYLYSLKDVKRINKCIDGRFVVVFSDFSSSIMDSLGRVQDKVYKNGQLEQRADGLFEHIENYKCVELLDRDGNVIADNIIYIDSESYDGIVYYIDSEGGKYIKKDGTPFLKRLDAFSLYANGIGSVKLPNGEVALISEREFLHNNRSYKMSDLFDQSEFDYDIDKYNLYILGDVDCVLPFINPDYTLFSKDGTWCVIDREGNFVQELKGEPVCHNKSDMITMLWNEEGRCFSRVYNMRLGRYVTPASRDILTGGEGGIIKREVDGQKCLFRADGSRVITESKFDSSGDCIDGLIPLYFFKMSDDWKYTYLRVNDGTTFSGLYDYAEEFSEGFGVVEKDGLRYYIDKNEHIFGEGYRDAEHFAEGRAAVAKKRKYSYIDRNFREVTDKFDEASAFSSGFGVVKIGNNFDAVSRGGVLLSQISMVAERIESDPRNFLDLKSDILKDRDVLDGLYNLALQTAMAALEACTSDLERRRVKALCEKITDSYELLKHKAKIYE